MATEYEIKILDINPESLKTHLNTLGAVYKGKKSFRRYVYDIVPPNPNKWIRLRTDESKTTLTVKYIIDAQSIDGTKEREIQVDSFDTTHELLYQLGYSARSYQENIRESYKLNDCDIEIDHRPHIPPYLEIEGSSVQEVEDIVTKLKLSDHIHTSENTTDVYARYGITDLIKQYPVLKFV